MTSLWESLVLSTDVLKLVTYGAGITVILIPILLFAISKKARESDYHEKYPFEVSVLAFQRIDDFLHLCLEFITVSREKYGQSSFTIHPLGQPTYVVTNSPENIAHVLKGNFDNYGKGPDFRLRFFGLLGDGIFNVDGKKWYHHRKTSSHLFNMNKFKGVVLDTFNEHCDTVISKFQMLRGQPFDIQNIMHKFTLDSIGKIAFGEDLGTLHHNKVSFADDFDYCQMCVNESFINPFWRIIRYCTPYGWSYFYRLWRLNKYAYKIVRQRRLAADAFLATAGTAAGQSTAAPAASAGAAGGAPEAAASASASASGENGKASNDLLNLYLTRQVETEPLSDSDLRDIILNFVIAGRDTTAQALSWAFFSLCTNPHVQEEARAEILRVLSKEPKEPEDASAGAAGASEGTAAIAYETLQEMKYLEAVCMETLRLYPSVPKEGKYVFNDDTLPDGTKVYKGDMVLFVPWVMGRTPGLWEEPLRFDPTRFLGASSKPSPFVFTAFQAGPRTCLGQNLALLEMKCCLARLLARFRFKLEQDPTTVTYLNSITLPIKGGLLVSATPIDA